MVNQYLTAKQAAQRMHDLGIKTKKTPDPVKVVRRKSRYVGVRTKLGFYQFIALLLEANEGRPKSEKMTDAEMTRQVVKEFPTSLSAQALRDGTRSFCLQRTNYNSGKFGSGSVVSVRYDEDGDPIRPRTREKITLKSARELYGNTKPYRQVATTNKSKLLSSLGKRRKKSKAKK